jgi:23S rRNA pseudouridine1911/1915/1917 synthase
VAAALRDQFAARKPRRTYTAIVYGQLLDARGTFRSYLTTDERTLNRYSVSEPLTGELAVTHFRRLDRFQDASFVEVTLETGRRNQIRVHFAEAGHPVLGDFRYAREHQQHPGWPHKRLALHAESLGLEHPITGEKLLFSAPWPAEFRAFRRQCQGKN